MEFKVNRETFATNEVVLDGSVEQAVELDYILPDYFPDIFRVLKCKLSPQIVSHMVSGDKLTFELNIGVKIMYLTENSNAVNTIDQKLSFTKSVDMNAPCEHPSVYLTPKADYANCRVVNRRRLDIRGAVSTKCKAVGEKKQPVVSDAFGANIQLKKSVFTYPSKKLSATKRVTVVEELEIGTSMPSVVSIVRSDACITSSEHKVMSNKLIVKGEAEISMLYSCQSENDNALEAMHFNIPFSQIIDMDGIDEHFEPYTDISVSGCELIPRSSGGEAREIECELVLLINCSALRFDTAELVTDAYSTCHECALTECEAKLDCMPIPISENSQVKTTCAYNEGEISCVYDIKSEVANVCGRYDFDNKRFVITSSVCFSIIAANENGCPICLDSEIPFEHCITSDDACEDSYIEPKITVIACNYSLISSNAIEIKAELKIGGYMYESSSKRLITDISVDESTCKQMNESYALKLYYAEQDEDIWEIAKKYSTSINAIIEENELSQDGSLQKGMLLIPLVK